MSYMLMWLVCSKIHTCYTSLASNKLLLPADGLQRFCWTFWARLSSKSIPEESNSPALVETPGSDLIETPCTWTVTFHVVLFFIFTSISEELPFLVSNKSLQQYRLESCCCCSRAVMNQKEVPSCPLAHTNHTHLYSDCFQRSEVCFKRHCGKNLLLLASSHCVERFGFFDPLFLS